MRSIPIIALLILIPGSVNAADALRCADFKRRRDGSWTNVRPIDSSAPDNPRGFHFPAGLVFETGNILDGLDVADVLNHRCRKPARSPAPARRRPMP